MQMIFRFHPDSGQNCRRGKKQIPIVLMTLAALAAPVLGAPPCGGPYRWAEENQFGPPGLLAGITTQDAIEKSVSVTLSGAYQLPTLGNNCWLHPLWTAWDYGDPTVFEEVGARFHIVKDPANPDGTQVFEVRALVAYVNPGGTLVAKIRRAPANPPASEIGAFVDTDLPEATGVVEYAFDPQPSQPDPTWVKAVIDLGAGASLETGDYYFGIKSRPTAAGPPLSTWYFDVVMDLGLLRGGFQTPENELYGDTTYGLRKPNPFIVIRACDPTPANQPPVASAKVVGNASVRTNITVAFDGSGSYDPEGAALIYSWDFGDGATDTGPAPDHAYSAAGSYNVVLTVSDGFYDVAASPLAITVTVTPPPEITHLKIERSVPATGDWMEIQAIHAGDDTTRLRFSATVAASGGGACPNCLYEWTDNGDLISTNTMPEGTTRDLKLAVAQPASHRLVLKVTDPAVGLSTKRSLAWTVSSLPTLHIMLPAPEANWGGPDVPDFVYRMPVWVLFQVRDVELQNTGQLELTDLDGTRFLEGTPIFILSSPPDDLHAGGAYSFTQLVRQRRYAWDLDDCKQPRSALTTYVLDSFDVQASGLVDGNDYHLPRLRSDNPVRDHWISVDTAKLDHYDEAWNSWLEYLVDTGAAESLGLAAYTAAGLGAKVAAGLLGSGGTVAASLATLALMEHDDACLRAHDPIVPDAQFQIVAPLPASQLGVSRGCVPNDRASNLVCLAEARDLAGRAGAAYWASMDKLAGAYAFVPAADPAWRHFAVLQGTEVVRQAQILANAWGEGRDAWTQAVRATPLTADDFRQTQEAVATNGWPDFLVHDFQLLGADPSAILRDFLAADAATVVSAWTNGPRADYDERTQRVLNQSYFAVPSGVVLVGITRPLQGAGVNGVITIDARVVHKKEFYGHCMCGDTVVSQVLVDGHVVAQVPLPNPDCPVLNPAPSAVPFRFDTRPLPEGPHTITVIAQDGCQAVPPDEVLHQNSDTISVFVDRTPPVLTITSADADPATPGLQVYAGDTITYTVSDLGSGMVGPVLGRIPTLNGGYQQTILVADQAGNTASAQVGVLSTCPLDANGNGIPDCWDAQYLQGVDASAEADSDQDGASNLSEYIAGTDPQRPESVFRLSATWNDGLVFSFLARRATGPGYEGLQRYYTVEYSASLSPADWQPDLEYRNLLGSDQVITFRPPCCETTIFVRVKVWLQGPAS